MQVCSGVFMLSVERFNNKFFFFIVLNNWMLFDYIFLDKLFTLKSEDFCHKII